MGKNLVRFQQTVFYSQAYDKLVLQNADTVFYLVACNLYYITYDYLHYFSKLSLKLPFYFLSSHDIKDYIPQRCDILSRIFLLNKCFKQSSLLIKWSKRFSGMFRFCSRDIFPIITLLRSSRSAILILRKLQQKSVNGRALFVFVWVRF